MEITVQVEKLSNISRKLKVRVPATIVANRLQLGLQEVSRTAKLKGFRTGMVPMNVVKQMYGADVRHQVFHNLIDESYREALRKEKIRAVGSPKIDTPEHNTGAGAHDHTIHENQDLTFEATVDVVPEIEVKGYTGLSLTRPKVEPTKEDIELVVKNLLDSHAQLAPVEGRAAKKGDHVDMAFSGGVVTDKGIDERPGMKGSRVLEIGSDTLIPGFEENLVGMKAGETKTFRIPFPADYFEKELAGKQAEFTVTISGIKEKNLPELNDEFAKNMGYEGVADMRKKAEEHLLRERTAESERKVKSDLLSALIEKNPFDVPQSLVMAQTRVLAQDVGQNLKQQGFTDQMVQEALGAEIEGLKKRAENQVRASLILETIAKKEKIEVTAADVDNEIKTMATNMNVDEARVREYYDSNPSRRDDIEFRLREDRTVAFLLEKSKVKAEK